MKKRIIYNSEISYEDAKESLILNGFENPTEEQVYEEQNFLSETFFDDEKCNLDKELDGEILCIADLGLWYGRRYGYKMMGNNLNEILFVGCDMLEVFCDGRNVKAISAHHDGTNYYTFREVKKGVNIDNLLNKIYNGTATSKDISRYTKSLAPYVKIIYGF